jgi:uncharacterized spore protein YtfJ
MKENLETETESGSELTSSVERLAARIGARARAASVFGEPIERGSVTIVPVAKIRWGFGGGAGAEEPGKLVGGGGGGGVRATPVGYIEIEGSETRYRAIRDPSSYVPLIIAGGVAGCLLLRGLRRLFH